uniref:Uncharacterized protein n=1 Tax=Strombidium inclinatum TaxID=197538 RepID=A0A7S3J1J7_9SPIT|mmetsp:Transcript_9845/g.14908  ORF Transcript_9845/g.14908 Transcript_9845/m.14908 type:complete len:306 (+) Transcript_9845:208-1125(+)
MATNHEVKVDNVDFELVGKVLFMVASIGLFGVSFVFSNGLAKAVIWKTAREANIAKLPEAQAKRYSAEIKEAEKNGGFWFMMSYHCGRGPSLGVFMGTKSLIILVFTQLSTIFISMICHTLFPKEHEEAEAGGKLSKHEQMHQSLDFLLNKMPCNFLLCLLISLQHSFYLLEYRCNDRKMSILETLNAYHCQWTYFMGFGVPLSAALMGVDYMLSFDDFSCKLASFMVFPLMVLISADTSIMGVTVVDETKKERSRIPILAQTIGINVMVMKAIFNMKEKKKAVEDTASTASTASASTSKKEKVE